MKFFYTNADQFVNKRDDLLCTIAGDEPDVILVTEVIPKSQKNPISPALLNIEGYEPHYNFNLEKENLGESGIRGVAIYTRSSITVREVEITVENFTDHLWVEILSADSPVLVGCIYRSPSNDATRESSMVSAVQTTQLIALAAKRNPNLIIAGDFNFKDIDWENDYASPDKPHQALFIKGLQDCFLHQHVTEPTRYRDNEIPNILDLLLSSEESLISDLQYLPPLGESDHICMKFKVNCSQHLPGPEQEKLDIFKANIPRIIQKLSAYNWTELLNSSFQEDYETFFSILERIMLEETPLKIPRAAKKNLYLTREANRVKSQKNRLWRKYLSTRSTFDNLKFKRCKNKLRSLTRRLRRDFERKLSANSKHKPKLFWNYAKSRVKSRDSISSLKREDGTTATSAADKAETLNKFFASVFTLEDLHTIPAPPEYDIENLLLTIEITSEQVKEKLENLNPNKSPGHDGWHPYFLRELSEVLCRPLTILFQKSLKEGAHESWRKAIVTAIFKKGKKTDSSNYRPVSLTSVISKLVESIIRDAIVQHLMNNNLITDDQHGFVPGRNCITQLLICIEEWTKRLEHNRAFDVIYTDFSKAFDSVPHERLFVKLQAIGIRGEVLRWIKSFLRGRTQCVNVDGARSTWRDVLSGIPQGSVIGPILFVIFINDMPSHVKHNLCKLFADDCKLYGDVKAQEENTVQLDLYNFENWSNSWQQPFNAKKCKAMHFGTSNPRFSYQLNGHTLEEIDSEKDLGVMIDDKLKFHKQTAAATKKANQILGVVKRSYKTRDRQTIATLYKSMVRPHLEYGNVIWGPFYAQDKKDVESVQRRATKLIPELKDMDYLDRLRALDIPTLEYRRNRGDMIQCYKIFNGIVRMNVNEMFTIIPPATTRSHTFGHDQRILRQRATHRTRVNVFSNRVIADWNSLPRKVTEATSTNDFKNKLDEHWKDRKFMTSSL